MMVSHRCPDEPWMSADRIPVPECGPEALPERRGARPEQKLGHLASPCVADKAAAKKGSAPRDKFDEAMRRAGRWLAALPPPNTPWMLIWRA